MNTLPTKRLDYLDNLKFILIVLVVFHHAGQGFGPGGAWGYHASNPAEYAEWLGRFFAVNAAFSMGLFFMISGYFVPRSFDKQGFGTFMWKKFLRLGVPILFIGGICTIATMKPDISQTWFCEQLLFFCLIYGVIRLLTKNPLGEPKKGPSLLPLFFGAAIILSLANLLVAKICPTNDWRWLLGFLRVEPGHFPQYVLFFTLGIIAYRQDWFNRMSTGVGLTSLLIGLTMSLLIYIYGAWGDNAFNHFLGQYGSTYEAFLAVFLCFGLIWLFRVTFNRTNKFWRWCSEQAYGIFVVHVLIMLGISFLTDSIYMGGGTQKFLFIGVTTTLASLLVTWLLRLIPGVKKVL